MRWLTSVSSALKRRSWTCSASIRFCAWSMWSCFARSLRSPPPQMSKVPQLPALDKCSPIWSAIPFARLPASIASCQVEKKSQKRTAFQLLYILVFTDFFLAKLTYVIFKAFLLCAQVLKFCFNMLFFCNLYLQFQELFTIVCHVVPLLYYVDQLHFCRVYEC